MRKNFYYETETTIYHCKARDANLAFDKFNRELIQRIIMTDKIVKKNPNCARITKKNIVEMGVV